MTSLNPDRPVGKTFLVQDFRQHVNGILSEFDVPSNVGNRRFLSDEAFLNYTYQECGLSFPRHDQ